MKLPTLSSLNVKNKSVLLRVDINSPVKNSRVLPNPRIEATRKTIQELKRKKAKIVILAHQSRPGKEDFISLKQHSRLLKVKFIPDIIGKKAIKAITSLRPGEALLLDNVRKLKEEFKPSVNNNLVKVLANLCDIYINDAFSVSHRNQTSIVSFPRVLSSAIGPNLEKELSSLKKIKLKNCLFILGGAKPKENIILAEKNKHTLTCGLFGSLCLIAKGHNLGKNNKPQKESLSLLLKLKKLKLKTPTDFALNVKGKRKELPLEDFPSQYQIYDIGEKTISDYIKKIKSAKYIFMKGPAGHYEDKMFSKGTRKLLEAIAESKAHSIIGGGHLSSALEKLKINKSKFSYLSLSGGALVKFIAGEKLPGLEVLKKRK